MVHDRMLVSCFLKSASIEFLSVLSWSDESILKSQIAIDSVNEIGWAPMPNPCALKKYACFVIAVLQKSILKGYRHPWQSIITRRLGR